MRVLVNGQTVEVDGSLADLVAARHEDVRGIAVALNDEVVVRGQWEACMPSEGDRIEIVTAVQGG